ncbi:hypothetical protein [Acinetobacter pittii]|uniref:hypothetical protein n=1 Tax=Acinetobacter pittii TaxID=48296 RepID=UPI0013D8390C|nr:hypothetical protein [Acinetobacter pittii]
MYIIPQPKSDSDCQVDSNDLLEVQILTVAHSEIINDSILYESMYEKPTKRLYNKKKLRRNLKNLSSATKMGKKKSFTFPELKATCNISYDRSSYEESTFVEYLLTEVIWNLSYWIDKYTKENSCEILLNLEWHKEVWRNIKGEEFNPLCIDDLEKMFFYSNPSKVIFIECPYRDSDPRCGFGLYLFDANDKLIFKTIYKFFDLADAPPNAFRLNVPISLPAFEDTSRSFLSCHFTTP